MNNDLVVMDNKLIRASYKLTVNEMRLILVALAQMPKDLPIDPNQAYYITKNDFVKFGVEAKNVAREIREACGDLLNRVVTIDTPLGDLHVHWVLNILHFKSEIFEKLKKQYPDSKNDKEFINQLRLHNLLDSLPVIVKSDENIVARIVFHPNMIPYISQLRQQFTKLNIADFFTFSSFYSFRIYMMMMQFKDTGFCKIHLDDLRDSLDLNDKYEASKDLKVRVIDTAIDEINEKSPYQAKYELIKTGRKFTYLEIKFNKKAKEISADKSKYSEDIFIKLSDSQLDTFSSKLSALPELGDMAHVGEEMRAFTSRLRSMLKDPEKQKALLPYLKEVGFKSTNY